MCYSAQIQADYRKYVKTFGAHMDIEEFARLYFERAEGSKAKIPKAVDDSFLDPQTDVERQIKASIDKFNLWPARILQPLVLTVCGLRKSIRNHAGRSSVVPR